MDMILLDDILNNKAKQEVMTVPESFSERRHSTIVNLQERKKHYKWRKAALQAAMFAVIIIGLGFSTLYIKGSGDDVLANIRNLVFSGKLSEKDFKSKKNGEFVFRNVGWGMSPEECFKAEGIPYDEKSLDFSLYNSDTSRIRSIISIKAPRMIFGRPAFLFYVFQYDKFYLGGYRFEFKEERLQEGLDFFSELEKELIKKYGMPVNTNIEPPNIKVLPDEEGLVSTSASWTMNGTKILKAAMTLHLHDAISSDGNGRSLFINLDFNGNKLLY